MHLKRISFGKDDRLPNKTQLIEDTKKLISD